MKCVPLLLLLACGVSGCCRACGADESERRTFVVDPEQRSVPGTIWVLGSNRSGQLGRETNKAQPKPLPIPELRGFVSLAAGGFHSVAVHADGTVWTWGRNEHGQLGDGLRTGRQAPQRIDDLGKAIAISAGESHTLVLRADGSVWAAGRNDQGQLGDGTNDDRAKPVQVLGDATAIAAGAAHSLAVKKDGTVWAWGGNQHRQLGDGSTESVAEPRQVDGVPVARAVAAGSAHSLALTAAGHVWAWGWNDSGQLGQGHKQLQTGSPPTRPVRVGMDQAKMIAAGGSQSMAIDAQGNLWRWGFRVATSNDSDARRIWKPAKNGLVSNVEAINAGKTHWLALTREGVLWGGGENRLGQLGRTPGRDLLRPERIDLKGVVAMAAGGGHSLAITGKPAVGEGMPASAPD